MTDFCAEDIENILGIKENLKNPNTRDAFIWYFSSNTPYIHLPGYMNRYWVGNPYIDNESSNGAVDPTKPSIRLHHILRADYDRHLHNHPWNAVSLIVKGWYLEELADGSLVKRSEGDINIIRHTDFHRITEVSEGGVWTMFVTYDYLHTWGFNTEEGFVESDDYFKQQT